MRYLVGFLRICGLVLIAFIGCLGDVDEGCLVDKCEGVVCPPDDNECTREGCSNATGSCTSWPVEDGTSCTYNGLSGVCVEGVCGENLCAGDPCNDDDACTDGTCDYVGGTCDFTPVVCDDHNPCTEDTCDPADECVFTAVGDGTACGGAYGGPYRMCEAGSCVAPCDLASDEEYPCPITGLEDLFCCPGHEYCRDDCFVPECDGPEGCDDQNECTEDRCVGGLCGNMAVEDGTACEGSTECAVAACANGACESTPVADGTACGNDAGTCQRGSCQVACTEQGIRDGIAAGRGPYTFDCDGPRTVVTEAEIVIHNDVILDGEGKLTVDGNQTHRVFFVSADVIAELRGMTVTGGAVPLEPIDDRQEWGGGIYNEGKLTLTSCTVSGNTARAGGGIYNVGGTYSYPRGSLALMNSTVSDNQASNSNGGIFNHGTMTVTSSTVSGNAAYDTGGGIANVFGTLTLSNSTVSGNAANKYTGGIFNSGVLTLINSTVSGNEADWVNGIENYRDGTLTMTKTVVDGVCYTGADATTSNGYNIESPGNTCGFDLEGDQANVTEEELNLGPLRDNGGPTMTHALLPGSVAIDVIPADMCEVNEDQRGEPRPGGTMCDVGAFEAQP